MGVTNLLMFPLKNYLRFKHLDFEKCTDVLSCCMFVAKKHPVLCVCIYVYMREMRGSPIERKTAKARQPRKVLA